MNHENPLIIQYSDLFQKEMALSSRLYRDVAITNKNKKSIRDLLDPINPFDKGVDPGSKWYMKKSNYYFIRTKALQPTCCLMDNKTDAIIPINPQAFSSTNLSDGDILLSKDSNIGECAIVDGNGWGDYMISGGIVRLHPNSDPYYLFSFLKHPLFKLQLESKVPRGSTISHAGIRWLDCVIPFPNGPNSEETVQYVSTLIKIIIEKEIAIKEKHKKMLGLFDQELYGNIKKSNFVYEFPTRTDLITTGRMDAGFWSRKFREFIFQIKNYSNGYWDSIQDAGYKTRRGQNLQISAIGQGYYFDDFKEGAYQLASPADVTDFMTIPKYRYYGNPRKLEHVKKGEVLFAAKGMRDVSIGHTYVNLSDEKFLTNIDAFLIDSGDLKKNIFLGELFSYYKFKGVFSKLSDTSNGGSFVEEYFKYLPIPKIPSNIIEKITKFYHNPMKTDFPLATKDILWHRDRNVKLGIYELELEIKELWKNLSAIQNLIISGEK